MKKFLLFILFIISFTHFSYAKENNTITIKSWNITDRQQQLSPVQKAFIKNQLIIYYPEVSEIVNNLTINMDINKNANNVSTSNGNPYDCNINISYKNNINPVLLMDFNNDVVFTILHEISHCVLNKDIQYKNMQWDNEISLNEQKKWQDYINNEEKKYLTQKKNKKQYLVPPMAVYHEIFSDTLPMLIMKYHKDKEITKKINYLISKRYKDYNKNPTLEYHVSYRALYNVSLLEINQSYNIQELIVLAKKISQKDFLIYLENRQLRNNKLGN
jgi:hypothetical protein